MHEYKAFRLQVKAVDDQTGEFSGYAAVFGNRDSYGDVIEPGAFAKTIADKQGAFPVLWQHDPWEPIGVTTEMKEDDKGLFVTAAVSTVAQRGAEALSLMKLGALTGLSIGYQTVQQRIDAGVRYLTEIKLWELSSVTFPANELALVTGVKSERIIRALTDWAEAERKVGKVLSASNQSLVESAIEALQALLAAAEPADATQDGKGAAAPPAGPSPDTLRAFIDHIRKEQIGA